METNGTSGDHKEGGRGHKASISEGSAAAAAAAGASSTDNGGSSFSGSQMDAILLGLEQGVEVSFLLCSIPQIVMNRSEP